MVTEFIDSYTQYAIYLGGQQENFSDDMWYRFKTLLENRKRNYSVHY
jgi:hypothetical protein